MTTSSFRLTSAQAELFIQYLWAPNAQNDVAFVSVDKQVLQIQL
jgi:hypothetical protein